MKALRIVFMGTPDFAVATLAALLKTKHQVVGVITAPDKPAGRGRKIQQSAVKKFALEHGLNILQPTNLKNEQFLKQLKSLQANLQIVAAFRMLPTSVWKMPTYGTFNLHASLLPDYRGAAPIHWAIINGEKKTGVTTFFIDEKIDTGEVILQKKIKISKTTTVGELHDALMIIGSKLVVKTTHLIAKGKVSTIKQPNSSTKKAPKLFSENCKIDWNVSRKNIYNKIRGLNPFPTAWTNLHQKGTITSLKIYDVEKIKEQHNFSFGSIITTKNEIRIAVKKGFINIKTLKLSGKRKMDAKSLLNGFVFDKDAYLL